MSIFGDILGMLMAVVVMVGITLILCLLVAIAVLRLLKQVRALRGDLGMQSRRMTGLARSVQAVTGPIPEQQSEKVIRAPEPAPEPEPTRVDTPPAGATVFRQAPPAPLSGPPWPGPMAGKPPSTNPLGVPAQPVQPAAGEQPVAEPRRTGRHSRRARHAVEEDE